MVAPPSNASKWQMGFNSAFKGLKDMPVVTQGQMWLQHDGLPLHFG
jgi:hypothetical protein